MCVTSRSKFLGICVTNLEPTHSAFCFSSWQFPFLTQMGLRDARGFYKLEIYIYICKWFQIILQIYRVLKKAALQLKSKFLRFFPINLELIHCYCFYRANHWHSSCGWAQRTHTIAVETTCNQIWVLTVPQDVTGGDILSNQVKIFRGKQNKKLITDCIIYLELMILHFLYKRAQTVRGYISKNTKKK